MTYDYDHPPKWEKHEFRQYDANKTEICGLQISQQAPCKEQMMLRTMPGGFVVARCPRCDAWR